MLALEMKGPIWSVKKIKKKDSLLRNGCLPRYINYITYRLTPLLDLTSSHKFQKYSFLNLWTSFVCKLVLCIKNEKKNGWSKILWKQ